MSRTPRSDASRRELLASAWEQVSAGRLREITVGLVDLPSPTGDEAPLAAHIGGALDSAGLDGHVMALDDRQASAWGRLRGDGTGPDLMLYAPIDTMTAGAADEDVPQIGRVLRPDMRVPAIADGDYVTGLGASNPKGHAACVLAAAEAIAHACRTTQPGVPLAGDLIPAFGAGGMPTNARPGVGNPRLNTGQGVGASFLLEQGVWTDYAVIAKPGWAVAWEEVGLAWFTVTVGGTHTYVGSRHRLPYRNAVVLAGEVAARLDRWFPEYTKAHTDGLVAPQGIVASINGGWSRTASFTPDSCSFTVDLRLSPRTTPIAAKRALTAALDTIAADLGGADISVEQVLAIPGATTSPDSWICRRAIAAWEEFEGRPHEPVLETSGATDGTILRSRGIPTVRIGMPKVTQTPTRDPVDFAMGMNTVDVREQVKLTRYLIQVAVDTITRPRTETGPEAEPITQGGNT
jgi:acetylornithine deacetylase/succinyl-diaminopimelate desuccinylase-like protein